jgi:hypothetical protein
MENTNYTNPTMKLPPKDAQLQGEPVQYNNTPLKARIKCLKQASKGKG